MGRERIIGSRGGLVIARERESDVQIRAFDYMKLLCLRADGHLADFAYMVPNGVMFAGTSAQRSRYMNSLKKQGFRTGVSDIVIAHPGGGYHGAYIEIKRDRRTPVSDDQYSWLARMTEVGYFTRLARGWIEVKAAIDDYYKHVMG